MLFLGSSFWVCEAACVIAYIVAYIYIYKTAYIIAYIKAYILAYIYRAYMYIFIIVYPYLYFITVESLVATAYYWARIVQAAGAHETNNKNQRAAHKSLQPKRRRA